MLFKSLLASCFLSFLLAKMNQITNPKLVWEITTQWYGFRKQTYCSYFCKQFTMQFIEVSTTVMWWKKRDLGFLTLNLLVSEPQFNLFLPTILTTKTLKWELDHSRSSLSTGPWFSFTILMLLSSFIHQRLPLSSTYKHLIILLLFLRLN